ncbi:MAG: YdcF family protein [Nitrospirales bacterium]|nr:YdcF family protein [Nitrospirales bacterium]
MLVVLGKNWRGYPPRNKPPGWRLHLSLESKMTALAAGHLVRSGRADAMLLSGGRTAGTDCPSEAEAMRAYIRKKFPDVPDQAILLEESSIDTAENAELIRTMTQDRAPQRITLLTIGFHLPRSLALFPIYGLPVERGIASETILAERSPHHQRFIRTFLKSRRVKSETMKEALLRLLLLVDPRAKIPRLLTRWLRR